MPLDLLQVGTQVRQMGELLASRRADELRRLSLLEEMLRAYSNRWEELAELAERVRERVAVPTGPLDERVPPPPSLTAYTALATDGAEIDPDRHGGSGDFFLINVGRVAIPYGQPGRPAELASATRLGYTEDDLFIVDPRDPRRQVPMRDRHLDALRTVEELRALADLAEDWDTGHCPASLRSALADGNQRERLGDASVGSAAADHPADPATPTAGAASGSAATEYVPAVALVDGTLLFSVLEERP